MDEIVSAVKGKHGRFTRANSPLQDGFRHWGGGNHFYPRSVFQCLRCDVRDPFSPYLFGHRFRDKDAIGKMAQDVGLATPAQEDQR